MYRTSPAEWHPATTITTVILTCITRTAGRLYRNDASEYNYLAVRLRGLPPNTEAAGSRVYATVGSVTQLREVSLGNNFISQNPTNQIFGIVQANQSIVVDQPDS